MATENKQLSTWMPPNEAEAVRALANREHRTVSQVLRLAALQYLVANGMAVPPAGEAA